jgi:hypothetical protein
LIAKAKAESGQDKGLLDILTKWEEANQKIFEQGDPGAGENGQGEDINEISLLEVAHQEINKAKEKSA